MKLIDYSNQSRGPINLGMIIPLAKLQVLTVGAPGKVFCSRVLALQGELDRVYCTFSMRKPIPVSQEMSFAINTRAQV